MGVCSGSFGDFPAQLISDLLKLGVDVHVAQPDYRKLFEMISRNQQANPSIGLPMDRLHLAEDRSFFYSKLATCQEAKKRAGYGAKHSLV